MMTPPARGAAQPNSSYMTGTMPGAMQADAPRKAELDKVMKNHRELRKTGQDTELILPDNPESSKLLGQQLDIHS